MTGAVFQLVSIHKSITTCGAFMCGWFLKTVIQCSFYSALLSGLLSPYTVMCPLLHTLLWSGWHIPAWGIWGMRIMSSTCSVSWHIARYQGSSTFFWMYIKQAWNWSWCRKRESVPWEANVWSHMFDTPASTHIRGARLEYWTALESWKFTVEPLILLHCSFFGRGSFAQEFV